MMGFTFDEKGPDQHSDGLVQYYSISSALAMETLQSCTKSSIGSIMLFYRR